MRYARVNRAVLYNLAMIATAVYIAAADSQVNSMREKSDKLLYSKTKVCATLPFSAPPCYDESTWGNRPWRME